MQLRMELHAGFACDYKMMRRFEKSCAHAGASYLVERAIFHFSAQMAQGCGLQSVLPADVIDHLPI